MIPRAWRYAWHNSADRRIVRAHGWADTAVTARPGITYSTASAAGDDPLVLAYAGLTDGLSHVLPFLEERRGTEGRRLRRRVRWAELTAARPTAAADLLAVGAGRDRLTAHTVTPLRHSLLLPFRINLTVPVPPDAKDVLPGVSRKARQQHAREVRSRSRTLEVVSSDADLVSFYHRMHLPTMRSRHGGAARSVDLGTARRCLFRQGVLFHLCEQGTPVAGMLCRLEGDVLVLRLAGVLDGSGSPYRSGTYMSLYIMIIEWAARNGITHVDLSGCEPFLSKGIFQFKRKLHPEVGIPGNHFAGKRLLLRVLQDRPVVRDFLVANPLLALDARDRLEAVYFHDRERPPRLDLRWECPGIAGHRLEDLDSFLAGLPTGPATTRASSADPARHLTASDRKGGL
ncbi:GNAT family N-acetyltransferase [Streptomyces sp. NPDC050759]|uniref:GNAT family N-acetyltransferase n=1 Tax=Streptomyces sp. NPDC050759 TaxID=3365635 RepID=UPI00379FA183